MREGITLVRAIARPPLLLTKSLREIEKRHIASGAFLRVEREILHDAYAQKLQDQDFPKWPFSNPALSWYFRSLVAQFPNSPLMVMHLPISEFYGKCPMPNEANPKSYVEIELVGRSDGFNFDR